jgi:hypothetical protein
VIPLSVCSLSMAKKPTKKESFFNKNVSFKTVEEKL